jgi:hypothetical protein
VQISIYTTIGIYQEKRCPNCRDVLKDFVCSAVESRQSMCEPKKLPSKAKFEWLVDRAEEMSQGYSFSGFDKYSEKSKDALRILSEFSRRNEEAEEDAQMRAVSGAAAPVPAHQMRAEAEVFDRHQIEREIERDFLQDLFRLRLAEQAQARADAEQDRIDALIFGGEPVPAHQMRAAAEAQARAIQMRAAAQVPAPPMRAGGGAAAPVPAPPIRAGGGAAAPVPAPPIRAGGGAAAPVRRRQYDSDSDGEYGYIRRYGS